MQDLRRSLPWVTLISLIRLVTAQTVVIGDATVAANASNVAPAAALVEDTSTYLPAETLQLTDAVIANLTSLSLSEISLFHFADSNATATKRTTASGECKAFPGDSSWPADLAWDVLDLLTGGALIKTVPLASSCYDSWGNYDATECAYITEQWTNSSLHVTDPTSVMSPIFQGMTCIPSSQSGTCLLGGYPSYAVNISSVAQLQLTINFARNLNLRFVVKNTGHDFVGRSSGAGAVSVWTRHLKDLEFYDTYKTANYSGPAVKAGAGIQGFELFDFVDSHGMVALGGECRTVGWGGGYIAGGGHSPLSSIYGMAADQILSIDVVTPDGRFVTADETHNTDLFWALSGGGGGTFGVVTSYTVKIYPDFPQTSFMTMSLPATGNVTLETFWEAVREWMLFVPTAVDAGHYIYFFIMDAGGYPELLFSPWLAPGTTMAGLKTFLAPLFAKWTALGISVAPVWSEYDSFLEAYNIALPQETVAFNTSKDASRLVPRDIITNETSFDTFFTAVKQFYSVGGQFVGYGITGGPSGLAIPDNAVNPAWRDAVFHLIPVRFWAASSTWTEIAGNSSEFTDDWMPILIDATPGGGGYASEGDASEPDFKQSYYGVETYDRLLGIKEKYDPSGLFYANKAVGSDAWYVTDQLEGLPTQNGKLCRV